MKQLRILLVAVFFGSIGMALAQPANNNLANRWVIVAGATTTNGTTVNAGTEANETLPLGSDNGRTVWYEWTAPANGAVSMSAVAGGYRVILAVSTGSAHPLSLLAAARAAANGSSATINFTATFGTSYKIMVDSSGFTSGGTFTL